MSFVEIKNVKYFPCPKISFVANDTDGEESKRTALDPKDGKHHVVSACTNQPP